VKLLDYFWPKQKALSLEKQRDHGAQAKILWNDESFKRAMDNVRTGIHDKWAESPVADVTGQHELRLMLKLLNDVEGNIRKEMNDGIVAVAQIKEEAEKKARKDAIPIFRR
jgi:hypothetical protein